MFDFDVVTGPAQPPKPVIPREDAGAKAAPAPSQPDTKPQDRPN